MSARKFGRCGQTLRETPEGDADGLSLGQLLATPQPLVSLVVGLSVSCVHGLSSQSSMYSRHFLNQEELLKVCPVPDPRGPGDKDVASAELMAMGAGV